MVMLAYQRVYCILGDTYQNILDGCKLDATKKILDKHTTPTLQNLNSQSQAANAEFKVSLVVGSDFDLYLQISVSDG